MGDPAAVRTPDGATLIRIYEKAETIRYADERIRRMLTGGEIHIHYYPVRGQEIIAAATSECLRPEDYVVTTYRGLHDQIAKGVPLRPLFAEYMGKVTGTSKGKGGPMHVTYPPSGLLVTSGVVGGGIPIANGVALASKVRGDGRVTVVNFGDGATNIGAFHEALNLAALWKLAVVFLCQNNLYAESTSIDQGTSITRLSDRAVAYGIPGVTVDGNDAVAMFTAAAEAVERARSGTGPTLVEAMTFRFFGHAFGDQDAYMPKEQKAKAMAADPLPRLREQLAVGGHADAGALAELDGRIHAEVDDALTFARESDDPSPTELETDVYG